MRGILVVVGLVVWMRAASASTVVVLSDPQNAPALGSALQVTLAGRGVAIATLPAPDGALRMDRAAAAQHAAISFNADAALWIDRDVDATEVCVVSADGRFFRHAPLPVGEGDTPRMFATIATSLLDELLSSADAPAVDVDVRVRVEPHGAPSVTPIVAQAPTAPPAPRAHMDHALVEIGPMVSPVSFGGELGISLPIRPSFRLGVDGLINMLATDGYQSVGGAMLEVRHVGRGTHHIDVGPVGGMGEYLQHSSHAIVFLGARVGYAWERKYTNMSLSLVPLVMTDSYWVVPAIYASLRLGFEL